ncbi:MAG: DUF2442 domain-containing protein [Gammaproteobacteria bacterium]|nr:DUF2442 domain-containing protein [Gammaproteobacteria bacterium]
MYWEIQKAIFKDDFSIDVQFADGMSGVVRVKSSRLVRVFEPLKNVALFTKGFVKYGAVTWNVGEYELDLAPDTMYHEIKKNQGVYNFE